MDWLVGFDDGSEILWELSVKLMLRRGDALPDPLEVSFGLKCGVPCAELCAEV